MLMWFRLVAVEFRDPMRLKEYVAINCSVPRGVKMCGRSQYLVLESVTGDAASRLERSRGSSLTVERTQYNTVESREDKLEFAELHRVGDRR